MGQRYFILKDCNNLSIGNEHVETRIMFFLPAA